MEFKTVYEVWEREENGQSSFLSEHARLTDAEKDAGEYTALHDKTTEIRLAVTLKYRTPGEVTR